MSTTIENAKVFLPAQSIDYADHAVVSKTIIKKPAGTVTLFSYDKEEAISEHTAAFDALVQVLDGIAEITIAGQAHLLHGGECIILPANIPHALKAVEKMKMMLVMIRS